jgi:hypothetical protein
MMYSDKPYVAIVFEIVNVVSLSFKSRAIFCESQIAIVLSSSTGTIIPENT